MAPLRLANGGNLWLVGLAYRNSTTNFESCSRFRGFTTNTQNLTFQSPLKLAVKSIVSLVRPTYKLFHPAITMKHLAAYLLLGLAGNTSPSDSDIKAVLESVGIDADEERLEKLLSELKGKDINELVAEGSTKLASVPSGGAGGGGGGAAAAGGAPAAGGAGPAAEEEKPAEKEEEKEESDEDMGFGLFD